MTTKERILNVMVEHIKGGTVHQVSLSQIAHAVDIAKSTLYEYFSSKEELIETTYRALFDEYEARLLEPLRETSYYGMFIEQFTRIVDITLEASQIMDAIMSSSKVEWMKMPSCMHETMKNMQNKMDERFHMIFMKGIEEKTLVIHNQSPYLSNLIKAFTSGLLMQFVHRQMDMDKPEFLAFLFNHIQWLLTQKTPV